MPLAVSKGTRPVIPDDIPSKMVELWNIAQECWSQNPWDRPSLPPILARLNVFASLEEISPFELRKPKPMQVIGKLFRQGS